MVDAQCVTLRGVCMNVLETATESEVFLSGTSDLIPTGDYVILHSCFVVPAHLIPLAAVKSYTLSLRNHSDNSTTKYLFYRYDPIKDIYYFSRGNMPLFKKLFSGVPIKDLRVSPLMKSPLEFTGEFFPGQKEVTDLIADGEGYGQVNAPPRFGKTVVMAAIASRLRLKTLLLTHQEDLSEQAVKVFRERTNIQQLEDEAGHSLVGTIQKWEDINKFDVCIMQYQKFLSPGGQMKLKEHRDTFGLVLVDEVHRASAQRYTEVHSSFSAKHRIGLSGTTETKSQKHKINDFTFGPVLVRAQSEKVPCHVQVLFTGTRVPFNMTSPKMFTYFLNHLESDQNRIDYLFNCLLSYAKAKHHIMGLSDRESLIVELVKRLKDSGIAAEGFYRSRFGSRKKERGACLDRVRSGETQVVIAMRSMTLGLDIPRLTTVFNLLPTSNAPNYRQDLSRVRTKTPWKNISYIVDFVDDHEAMKSCYRTRRKVYVKEGFEITGDEFLAQKR